jgi:hypothetical protein
MSFPRSPDSLSVSLDSPYVSPAYPNSVRVPPHQVAGSPNARRQPMNFRGTGSPTGARVAARFTNPPLSPVLPPAGSRLLVSSPQIYMSPLIGRSPPTSSRATPIIISAGTAPQYAEGSRSKGGNGSLALIILGIFLAIVGIAEPTGILFVFGFGISVLGVVLANTRYNRDPSYDSTLL